MKKRFITYTSILFSLLIIAGCGTNRITTTHPMYKQVASPPTTIKNHETNTSIPKQENKSIANNISSDKVNKTGTEKRITTEDDSLYLSSNIKLTIPRDDVSFTLNGTMKMKTDERIQFSIVMPIFHNELMKADIAPNEIIIIDRMNKQYIQASKNEISPYLPENTDFSLLVKLLKDASKPNGKNTFSASEFGFEGLKNAQISFSDFSTKKFNIEPTTISTRYKKITIQEFIETLKGLK